MTSEPLQRAEPATLTVPGSEGATAGPGRGLHARQRLRLNVFRYLVLAMLGLFFLVPIGALTEFSTRGVGLSAPRTLEYWQQIGTYSDLVSAITASLELAALTVAFGLLLLVPTMVWVRLRLPRLARTVEFLCLLPLTIPAIALVVGLAPIYRWLDGWLAWYSHRYGLPSGLADTPLQLFLVYVVLVLPYTFRAIDTGLAAIDVRTLSEAARSLGAGWPTVMFRVIVPNIGAALLNAALLSVALVLGEYTIASLLNFQTIQVAVVMLGRANAGVSIAVSDAALMFGFVLLVALSFVGRRRRRRPAAPAEEE
ncbi:MAG TPA: ABC transporter permease subunit [Kineosporiaceae bacterium]|nr:ABC transporter permease subunit [Kineosporiaceae bacterium]